MIVIILTAVVAFFCGWALAPQLDHARRMGLARRALSSPDYASPEDPRPATTSRLTPILQHLPDGPPQYDEATVDNGAQYLQEQARAIGVPLSLKDARAEAIRMLSEIQ